jgi:hypothetical protein
MWGEVYTFHKMVSMAIFIHYQIARMIIANLPRESRQESPLEGGDGISIDDSD